MYVILTSKPGEFRTDLVAGLTALERYDYFFCGRKRAEFVIATLEREVKIRIVEEGAAALVNEVPTKFLPRYATLEQARAELRQLAGNGALEATLERR